MTDYKNKYIKYLNMIGGNPLEIDLNKCIKFTNFEKIKTYTKNDLEKYDYTKCVSNITDPKLKIICETISKLISNMYDLVKFFDIFKGNITLVPLIKEISDIFNFFQFKFFKFYLSNLLIFLYNFTDFLKIFIDKIDALFVKVFENIVRLTINNKYFLLHLKGEISVEEININIFIRIFRQCYITIFELIKDLGDNIKTNKVLLFNIFNVEFKKNILLIHVSSVNNLNETFTEYENNLCIEIPKICENIEKRLTVEKIDDKCKIFNTALMELKKESTLSSKVENFLTLLNEFNNCIKKNKKEIYENLVKIGVILKFLSVPKKQKEIEEKLKDIYDLFTRLEKVSVEKDNHYITKFQTNLDLLEGEILWFFNEDHKIYKDYIEFKESITLPNINEAQINAFSNIYNEIIKNKKDIKPVKDRVETIYNILKDNIKEPKKSNFTKFFKLNKKIYKIENLKLIGGLFYADIDLKFCSKFSYFKRKNLGLTYIFVKDNWDKEKKALLQYNINNCLKEQIKGRNFDNKFEIICKTLLELVCELHDFVLFIQIFRKEDSFNEDFKVEEITSKFNSFNFVLDLHKLPNFLYNFFIFLEDFVEKINILFKNVLSKKNQKIYELDFKNFEYFSLSFEYFSVFHKNTFVNCPIYFKVFRERYENIFKYIKKLSSGLTDDIIKILTDDFELYSKIAQFSNFNIRNPILEKERELRKEIKIIYEDTRGLLVDLKPGCLFSANLFSFVTDCGNPFKYNNEIIKEFLKILNNFSCIEKNKKEIYKNLVKISNILKRFSTKEESINIDENIKKITPDLKYDVKSGEVDDLEKKLLELQGNLLFCFNADHEIFNEYIKFKTNLNMENKENIIKKIEELDKINNLLKDFIIDKSKKCIIPNIHKGNLKSELSLIKDILTKKLEKLEKLEKKK
jgi:hypothetical protein